MISVKHKGSFKNIESFLTKNQSLEIRPLLENTARNGDDALLKATPKDTGLTSQSWRSDVQTTKKGYKLTWYNDNVENGILIAVILQYGFATKNGGFVPGRNYINPALNPVVNSFANNVWLEVNK